MPGFLFAGSGGQFSNLIFTDLQRLEQLIFEMENEYSA